MNKKDRKDKDYLFWTNENDVVITEQQCLNCKFQTDDVFTCIIYKDRKPEGVIWAEEECPKFEKRQSNE